MAAGVLDCLRLWPHPPPQDAKIEQMRQERERVREEAAREKARERERKLEARNAALQSSTTQLEKKIQLKVCGGRLSS